MITMLMSIALLLAWRGGRRVELQQITLVMVYLVSGAGHPGLAAGAGIRLRRELLRPRLVWRLRHRLRPRCRAHRAHSAWCSNASLGLQAIPAVAGLGIGRAHLAAHRAVVHRRLGCIPPGLRRDARPRCGGHCRLVAAAGQRAAHRRPAGQPAGGRCPRWRGRCGQGEARRRAGESSRRSPPQW